MSSFHGCMHSDVSSLWYICLYSHFGLRLMLELHRRRAQSYKEGRYTGWPSQQVMHTIVDKKETRKKKQHKHKLFGPDFPQTFLTLTPGCPRVKKFLPTTGAAGKRTFWCGRPCFSARTSMLSKNFVQKKFALIFWPLKRHA